MLRSRYGTVRNGPAIRYEYGCDTGTDTRTLRTAAKYGTLRYGFKVNFEQEPSSLPVDNELQERIMRELVVRFVFAIFEAVKQLGYLEITGQLVRTLPRIASNREASRRARWRYRAGVDQFVGDLLNHVLNVLEVGPKAVNA